MKRLAVLALLALLALPASGLEPYLVKDINPVPAPAGSNPSHPVTLGGAVLFFADDGISRRGLWRSDGTAAGTFELTSEADLVQPGPLLVTERLCFFLSSHPLLGPASLWVSDGTPAGTFRLTDPGVAVVPLGSAWVAGQGVLYFPARNPEHGTELWRTDGTPAGTHLVADVRPGPEGSDVQGLTEYRGRVWFGADDGQRGGALWSSDGTAAGTVLAVDPVPSSASHGSPEHLRVVGKRLAFFALPPGRGRSRQLWAGDGTAKGTAPVTHLSKGAVGYPPVSDENRLYFVVELGRSRQLWVSDGTGRGTRSLLTFPRAFNIPVLSPVQGLRGLFVFMAFDPAHGTELWVTDGTPRGTRLLRDVCLGPCSSGPVPQRALGGRLYFIAAERGGVGRLWSTDGTPEGTRRVSDVDFGYAHSFFAVGGELLFVAATVEDGWEIWRSNGTAPGTFPVTEFADPFLWEDEGFHGAVLNGVLLFRGEDGEHGAELWRSDGTSAGTWLVEDINRVDVGGSFPRSLRPMRDEVVFVTGSFNDPSLWKSDGTAAGTTQVRTFGPDERDGGNPQEAFAEAGGRLFYFSYDRARDRYVPWRTDGTEAGTFGLADEGVPGCCRPPAMAAMGSTAFFDLRDEEHGRELWASDGTREGTRLVLDLVPGRADSEPRDLTAFQGKLFFTAGSSDLDRQLWRSDGTAAGTVPILDLTADDTGSVQALLTVHSGRLWFFARDAEHGVELWSSDGTETGSRLEAELLPGPGSFLALFMASLGDRLVLSVHREGLWVADGTGTRKIHDHEIDSVDEPHAVFQGRLYFVAQGILWVTNGTEAGTRPFLDRTGSVIFSPDRFAVLGNRLVFTAQDIFGPTLWESDGTPAGTFQVEPRVRINSPEELVGAGDRVFYPGYDFSTGWELWAVRP